MKNVCVFLSASDLEKKYSSPAKKLGELLAQNDMGFVYGGSDKGLMKVMADAVQEAGGSIIGVSMEMLRHTARINADEMIIAKDLPERKKIMNDRSDAVIVMVGGIGTLDEATEILELKKHGLHNKQIIFLNTDNFYEGLKIQLLKMEADGFLPKKINDLVLFADTPEEVIALLKK